MRRALDASIPLRRLLVVLLLVAAVGRGGVWSAAKGGNAAVTAPLVRSSNAPGCVPNATGTITIVKQGNTEKLTVSVSGMPKKADFDVFVIQSADAPFGVSWYQGDLTTDKNGKGSQSFVGRFSIETFIVAPGVVAVPQIHTSGTFKDAVAGVATAPIHTFHVGLWFNSPTDAAAAGCANTETPFNGDHTAGPQVLKTVPQNNGFGPLEQVQ